MDNIKQFVDLIVQGENLQAKSVLEDELSARAFEALDAKKKELASGLFGGVSEEVEQLDESDLGNGYKIRMKHSEKGRIHSPSGEHVADVTKEGDGWRYHAGSSSKWHGAEFGPHYRTGVEKNKLDAARKAAEIHANMKD